LKGEPINVFNHGKMRRDFTFVDDIVEGIIRVHDNVPQANPDKDPLDDSTTAAPYKIYNIGNNQPVELMYMIEVLEQCLGKTATKNMMDIQPGDVPETFANIDALQLDVGFRPATGIERFVDWYKSYHSIR